jgi:dipeptidyl aminopeptidase/acylaminoacyl peptidase
MVNQIVNDGLCDREKIFAVGKSYGGYLSGIMGSRMGEFFKAVVIMNPAINFPFMIYSSGNR